jgi:hypothetical protein
MSNRVVLELVDVDMVKPPDWCPYKTEDMRQEQVFESNSTLGRWVNVPYSYANPKICALCKLCTFVPKTNQLSTEELTESDRDVLIQFLTNVNTPIANSIAGQHQFLSSKQRQAVVILISAEVLDESLIVLTKDEPERYHALKSNIILSESPICYILGCPVYFSSKLGDTPVQVVGAITWR